MSNSEIDRYFIGSQWPSPPTILGAGWATLGYSAAEIDAGLRGVGYLLHEGGEPARLRSFWLDDDTLFAVADRAEALRREPAEAHE